jgi:extracellular elastinolytic metalloproteinase
MTPSITGRRRRHRYAAAASVLLTMTLVPGLAQLSAGAASSSAPAAQSTDQVTTLGDAVPGLSDLDARGATVPSAAQKQAVARLGAVDVRWNQYGTPTSLLPSDGVLASATSTNPVKAARNWLLSNAAVFGLSAGQVDALQLVNDQRLAQSSAHAVLFRQVFGGLPAALDSMVTVGVANGDIAYASSSLAKTAAAPPKAQLSATQAWLKAATNVGHRVSATNVGRIDTSTKAGWTVLSVPNFAQDQRARLRSLAMADGAVRPVFETSVTDVDAGSAFSYKVIVDAVDGRVLWRQNQVENNNDAFPFQGEITASNCGPMHDFELTDGNTKRIDAAAAMANTVNDIVITLFDPNGQVLAKFDSGTSPEAVSYTSNNIPRGIYHLQVCPFQNPTVPFTPPGNYAAMVTTSDQGAPDAGDAEFSPRWRLFSANPNLASLSAKTEATNSVIGCWLQRSGCTLRTGPFVNPAAPGPWDTNPSTGQSTLSTDGNNATTHEAWVSPLTPGGFAQAPIEPQRRYTEKFTDVWNDSKCDPSNFHPGGNDINPVVTNLFVSHNRMHDYAYDLGFTERNYNMQKENFSRGGRPGDPEVGNAQAGALTGGQPTFLGRDNANQITEADGVSGITNQYLFQPIAGAFYAPCADGSLDMGVVGHEYTHAISNRMIGGPDNNISSDQGGAMGESWGDLTASEYQFSHGYSTGVHPFIEGAYATGNRKAGIRDYAIYKNPLNYSDYGFDLTGPEVHADGEIWNGTQWSVRQALVKRHNRAFPYSSARLQKACSEASVRKSPRRPVLCPGNRRWIQLVFDAFLLQQPATSMLDARDAMLAADRMRFHGNDLKVMWRAFAQRGMGSGAKIKNADDAQPRASFASPKGRNGTVRFQAPGPGQIYVGRYQARVTPVADTNRKSKLDASTRLVPGHYQMLYVSKQRGFKRFSMNVRPGRKTVRIHVPVNIASKAAGAKVIASSAGSLNPGSLIDGTEGTNWGGVNGAGTSVDQRHPFVVVDLAGRRARRIHRVQVSAMLHPSSESDPVPLAQDPDSGSRFTALRKFALEACVRNCAAGNAHWKRFYTSAGNAFPAVAPRPVAPNLTLRGFNVRDTRAKAIRFVVLENQCSGTPDYAGEQDNDPTNDTDCKSASDRDSIAHAAELQVY